MWLDWVVRGTDALNIPLDVWRWARWNQVTGNMQSQDRSSYSSSLRVVSSRRVGVDGSSSILVHLTLCPSAALIHMHFFEINGLPARDADANSKQLLTKLRK
jgi:hypothetical protein